MKPARQIVRDVPGAQLESFAGDLSQAAVADSLIRKFDGVDILVNNLGIYAPKPFEEITDRDWTAIIEANFLSGVRLSRHYLPRMKQAGWGRILFISSESAVNIPSEMIHYGVTKTMQVALARGLAETTAGTAVTVNSLLAGPTRSEGVEEFVKEMAQSQGVSPGQVEKEFFQKLRPSSLIQRFETHRRNCRDGRRSWRVRSRRQPMARLCGRRVGSCDPFSNCVRTHPQPGIFYQGRASNPL